MLRHSLGSLPRLRRPRFDTHILCHTTAYRRLRHHVLLSPIPTSPSACVFWPVVHHLEEGSVAVVAVAPMRPKLFVNFVQCRHQSR